MFTRTARSKAYEAVPVGCPIPGCGERVAHLAALYNHVLTRHGYPGRRTISLAVEVARAEVRGWPTEGPRSRLLECLGIGEVPR